MNDKIKCPVCQNADGGSCQRTPGPLFECDICGRYTMSLELDLQIQDGAYNVGHWSLNRVQRAVLSHLNVRSRQIFQRRKASCLESQVTCWIRSVLRELCPASLCRQ